jgi:hypothetical protein
MKAFFLALLLSVAVTSLAQRGFNYQGYATDNGVALKAHQIGLRISILEGTIDGQVVFSETHTVTTSSQGVFSIVIGSGIAEGNTFESIDWSKGEKFIKTEIDPTATGSYALSTVSQLVAVPYALYAENVKNADKDSTNEIQTLTRVDNKIILSKGGEVSVDDADASLTNELQTLSLNGDTLTLSQGNAIKLPAGGSLSDVENSRFQMGDLKSLDNNFENLVRLGPVSDGVLRTFQTSDGNFYLQDETSVRYVTSSGVENWKLSPIVPKGGCSADFSELSALRSTMSNDLLIVALRKYSNPTVVAGVTLPAGEYILFLNITQAGSIGLTRAVPFNGGFYCFNQSKTIQDSNGNFWLSLSGGLAEADPDIFVDGNAVDVTFGERPGLILKFDQAGNYQGYYTQFKTIEDMTEGANGDLLIACSDFDYWVSKPTSVIRINSLLQPDSLFTHGNNSKIRYSNNKIYVLSHISGPEILDAQAAGLFKFDYTGNLETAVSMTSPYPTSCLEMQLVNDRVVILSKCAASQGYLTIGDIYFRSSPFVMDIAMASGEVQNLFTLKTIGSWNAGLDLHKGSSNDVFIAFQIFVPFYNKGVKQAPGIYIVNYLVE